MKSKKHEEKWDLEIKPSTALLNINIKELFQYRDLVLMMIRRDFVAFYKQTILGPIWFFLQPILTTFMYLIIFGRVANLSTDDTPPILFYLAGVTCWNYFSEVLTKTSDTFIANANIFGKVYFPRLVIPVSIVISNMIRLGIQLFLFLLVWLYYLLATDSLHPNWDALILLPFLILLMAGLGLGCGIIFSSITTRYRDMRFLLQFGVQLFMFATPIVYPLAIAPEKYKFLLLLNPFTAIIETFRYGFLGHGVFSWIYLSVSTIITLIILALGLIFFNKVEKTFIDTV